MRGRTTTVLFSAWMLAGLAGVASAIEPPVVTAQPEATPTAPATPQVATPTPTPAAVPQAIRIGRCELIGTVRVAGDAKDKSGLIGTDPSGVAEDLLGSFGSGIDLVPGSARVGDVASVADFVAICDRGPFDGMSAFKCRVQKFRLTINPSSKGSDSVLFELTGTTMLTSAAGKPFVGSLSAFGPTLAGPGSNAANVPARLDPESIRIAPGVGDAPATWWISEEYGPWIDQFSTEGKHLRRVLPPAKFLCQHPGATYEEEMPPQNFAGRLPNRGFESLAIAPSGKKLFAMPQSPLLQDNVLGERNRRVGVNIRLLEVTLAGGDAAPTFREFVYPLDQGRGGVNEVLALSDDELLVLERDGAAGAKAEMRRVYAVDLRKGMKGATPTDVSKVEKLPRTDLPESIVALEKRVVLDLLDPAYKLAGESMPEKIEGLSLGPTLADGRRTLIVATDNDLIAEQATVLWVFAFAAE